MKKFDDDLEFESLNDEPRDTRFILPIIVVAVLLVIVIVALVLLGKNKDTSADLMSTEQSETTETETQTTEVIGNIATTESTEEVKGPKGQLELDVFEKLAINVEDNVLTVSRPDDERETRARHGLTRALIHNMVVGVSEGFEKKLELAGVGYRVQQKGKNLEFSLGFSHPVIVEAPEGITFEVPDNTHVNVKGINKQQVGQIAAEIRGHRPPEPYKGKGIHYVGEHIRRKLGKAAK